MNVRQPYIMLSVAGSDSGAGAGIQADLKSAAACGAYGATAVTALTAQNTAGVTAIEAVSPQMVEKQMRAVLDDMPVRAVKSGMLYSPAIVDTVAKILTEYRIEHYVLDPVMVSTSGHPLIEKDTARRIVDKLFPLASLVTPNLPECSLVTGIEITKESQFETAAAAVAVLGPRALLLKAGHLQAEMLTDCLFDFTTGETYRYGFPRIDTLNTHGTGCSLSAAIASFMARGFEMADAVARAEAFLHKALKSGTEIRYGAGHGPVRHFFNLQTFDGDE